MIFENLMIFKDFIKWLIVKDLRELIINIKTYEKSSHLTRDFNIISLLKTSVSLFSDPPKYFLIFVNFSLFMLLYVANSNPHKFYFFPSFCQKLFPNKSENIIEYFQDL